MAVNPAVVKVVATAATDKRVWTAVGSVIVGIVATLICFVASFLNMFAYDDSGNGQQSPAYVSFIKSMKDCYKELDVRAEEKCPALDKDQIHAVFYTLYFGEEKNMTAAFYDSFVECFINRKINEAGEETVTPCGLDTALERLEKITNKVVESYSVTQITELYSLLKYQAGTAGSDEWEDVGGPAPEAFNDATFSKLMQEATKYIGFPYVWGGSSPATSFDCSGFVCWSYTKSGVYNLPRTTAQGIYNQCRKISAAEVQPGDLVFFTRTYVSSNPVTHVGIYVGGGKMLHCGDPIRYASIQTEFWKSHFYGFGRLPTGE